MDELRSYSSRARITPTRVINHYEWGDFKGDEDALKLRLPARLLQPATADQEGGEWVEGQGQLSSMISVRAELARGDLRDLDTRAKGGEFQNRLEALRQAHAGKPTLIERLRKARLSWLQASASRGGRLLEGRENRGRPKALD